MDLQKKKKKKEKKKKTENLQSKGTLEKYEKGVFKEIYWDNKRNPKSSENSDVV